jgi:hypothetical protein
MENIGGWGVEWTENIHQVEVSRFQNTASFIVHQSTHTYILLVALIFPKCPVDKAFATNVSYSAGHLTSIL